ncbi:hypothetical protein FACS189431_0630 [Alphaproteobacteria bacterium]|nr:hypothetical protein FACS189431_0630 [Alphaproteobacteria bacterium]
MGYKYTIIPAAQKEYDEIIKYYVENADIMVAENFALKIRFLVETLEDFPEIGTILDAEPKIRSIRIKKYPYRLYYTVDKNGLEVVGLSLYHSKRDLDNLIPELKRRINK